MKKIIPIFVVLIGVAIIGVSAWVVIKARQGDMAQPIELPTETTTTNSQATTSNTTTETSTNPVPLLPTTPTPHPTVVKQLGLNYEERMQRGEQAYTAGEFDKAITEFTAASLLQPSNLSPLIRLTRAQIELRQLDRATANLATAERINPEYPEIAISKGVLLLRQENFLAAEAEFQKAGDTAFFWRGLVAAFYDKSTEAQSLLRNSQDPKANYLIAAYDEYALYPDSPKTHIDTLLVRAFCQIGEYELAIAKIKPVLGGDPDYRDAWILLGYAQYSKKNYSQAREAWNYAYALDPGKPETQYFLGLANLQLSDYNEAEKYLALAKANQFASKELDTFLAEIYFRTGKYREAADLLKQRIDNDKTVPIDDFARPIYLFLSKLNDGSTAWKLASEAANRYPNEPLAHNFTGWVSLENGYLDQAESELKKAIELDPQHVWSNYNLARYYEKVGDLKTASAAYKKTYELDKNGAIGSLAAQGYNRLLQAS